MDDIISGPAKDDINPEDQRVFLDAWHELGTKVEKTVEDSGIQLRDLIVLMIAIESRLPKGSDELYLAVLRIPWGAESLPDSVMEAIPPASDNPKIVELREVIVQGILAASRRDPQGMYRAVFVRARRDGYSLQRGLVARADRNLC